MKPLSDPPAVVPSFVAKIARAKKHLAELEGAIAAFADLRPYSVAQRRKGKRQSWCLEFTADPANTDIPIVAADVIYNLRSSLDHLMASLVAPKRRSGVMFPVFWKGVWEAPIPGENDQRTKDRAQRGEREGEADEGAFGHGGPVSAQGGVVRLKRLPDREGCCVRAS